MLENITSFYLKIILMKKKDLWYTFNKKINILQHNQTYSI